MHFFYEHIPHLIVSHMYAYMVGYITLLQHTFWGEGRKDIKSPSHDESSLLSCYCCCHQNSSSWFFTVWTCCVKKTLKPCFQEIHLCNLLPWFHCVFCTSLCIFMGNYFCNEILIKAEKHFLLPYNAVFLLAAVFVFRVFFFFSLDIKETKILFPPSSVLLFWKKIKQGPGNSISESDTGSKSLRHDIKARNTLGSPI